LLCLALGKLPGEIEAMPERHLLEFEQLYEKQPFGLWRDDYRMAQLAVIVARAAGNKLLGFDHLMTFWDPGGQDGFSDIGALVIDAEVVE